MAKWKVTATLKGKDGESHDMVWQNEGTEMGAIISVSQLFCHADDSHPYTPELLEIKIVKV